MSHKYSQAVDRKLAKESVNTDAEPARSIKATELLGENRTLLIKHAGSEYTLRITRNDRLILTK